VVAGESIPVKRLYDKDIATDELFELLGVAQPSLQS
jgi:hypothetical protein